MNTYSLVLVIIKGIFLFLFFLFEFLIIFSSLHSFLIIDSDESEDGDDQSEPDTDEKVGQINNDKNQNNNNENNANDNNNNEIEYSYQSAMANWQGYQPLTMIDDKVDLNVSDNENRNKNIDNLNFNIDKMNKAIQDSYYSFESNLGNVDKICIYYYPELVLLVSLYLIPCSFLMEPPP
jgi:hypothetical protein